MPQPDIRAARPEDCETLHALVVGLAEYERLAHAVVGSVEDLRAELFAVRPVIEAAQRAALVDGVDDRPAQRKERHPLPLETQKKEVEVVRYYYQQDGEEVALHFVDGKLISPVQMLGHTPLPSHEAQAAPPPDGVQKLTMPK